MSELDHAFYFSKEPYVPWSSTRPDVPISLIYLATPYSHKDKEVEKARFEIVTKVSAILTKHGYINFSPITQSHEQSLRCDMPTNWHFWQHIDRCFLRKCDELWVLSLPGWLESVGVTAEIEFAKSLNKTIRLITYREESDDIFFLNGTFEVEVLS